MKRRAHNATPQIDVCIDNEMMSIHVDDWNVFLALRAAASVMFSADIATALGKAGDPNQGEFVRQCVGRLREIPGRDAIVTIPNQGYALREKLSA